MKTFNKRFLSKKHKTLKKHKSKNKLSLRNKNNKNKHNKNNKNKHNKNKQFTNKLLIKYRKKKQFGGNDDNNSNPNLFVLHFKKKDEKKKSMIPSSLTPAFNFAEETDGWRNLKDTIRQLPHNKDINKHGEMTALKINDTSGHVKLNVFANNLANAIILQFSNMFFKSNGKSHEYNIIFKDIIINDKKGDNDANNLYLPLPITIPTLSINDLLSQKTKTSTEINTNTVEQQEQSSSEQALETLKCENIIPQNQIKHLDDALKKKNAGDIKQSLNEITFNYDFKNKIWTTNLTNIYNLIGISFEGNNSEIDPSIPFWDTNDDHWDNVNKNKVGIQGISIEIIKH
jgi:hypothetical protein